MRVFRPNSSHDSCNDQNEPGNSGLINRTRIDYLRDALPASPLVGVKEDGQKFLEVLGKKSFLRAVT